MSKHILLLAAFICLSAAFLPGAAQAMQLEFNGAAAYEFAEAQLALGPRLPGSEAHAAFLTLAETAFSEAGWTVQRLRGTHNGQSAVNLIIERPDSGKTGLRRPWILFGAHYDSRLYANEDPDPGSRRMPVPGGNDGASGVAVLYGLARSFDPGLPVRVTLALFDLEDQGDIEPFQDWCIGSTLVASYYEAQPERPDAVVILDMIGDPDLSIFRERNSDAGLGDQLWAVAAELGHEAAFVNREKFAVYDDHIPFLERGMRAVDLIDFDDPEWHTVRDDLSNVSQESLRIVGEVVLNWAARFKELNPWPGESR